MVSPCANRGFKRKLSINCGFYNARFVCQRVYTFIIVYRCLLIVLPAINLLLWRLSYIDYIDGMCFSNLGQLAQKFHEPHDQQLFASVVRCQAGALKFSGCQNIGNLMLSTLRCLGIQKRDNLSYHQSSSSNFVRFQQKATLEWPQSVAAAQFLYVFVEFTTAKVSNPHG